jgi:fermentation-respiration switch protein FrsA (DUF1100 family)
VARRWARLALAAGLLAALAMVSAISFLPWLEKQLVYHPDRRLRATPAAAQLSFDDVWLTAEDGVRLHAWHVHAPAPVATVVVCHGNAGNISHRIPLAAALAREGLETLLLDYRGYGGSGGSPWEDGLYRDGEAARRWAEGRGLPLVLYGESLGGAVAVELAVRRAPALLVVQSSFTGLRELVSELVPVGRLLVRQRFSSLEKITRLASPLLVVHGDRDELVPHAMGQALFAAVPGRKELLTVSGGGHNDIVVRAGPEIAARVRLMAAGL